MPSFIIDIYDLITFIVFLQNRVLTLCHGVQFFVMLHKIWYPNTSIDFDKALFRFFTFISVKIIYLGLLIVICLDNSMYI